MGHAKVVSPGDLQAMSLETRGNAPESGELRLELDEDDTFRSGIRRALLVPRPVRPVRDESGRAAARAEWLRVCRALLLDRRDQGDRWLSSRAAVPVYYGLSTFNDGSLLDRAFGESKPLVSVGSRGR